MARRNAFLRWAIPLLLLFCLLWFGRSFWLSAIGGFLVASDPPGPAQAILVLAGDHRGNRILKACELLREGAAPVVFVSGPTEWYGVNEAVLAIRFAVSKGCPERAFEPLFIRAFSTVEEADAIVPLLEQRGIRDLLVVTSDFHTSRSRRVYLRRAGGRMKVRMAAAPDPYFSPEGWWRTREGQKTVFFELSKTIAWWVGL